MRPFLAGLFALILAATSLTMAVARGQSYAAGEIVLCSGYGVATLEVDARGNPVGPVHLCPDMVLGLIAATALTPLVLTRPEGAAWRLAGSFTPAPQGRAVPATRARDPPVLS